MDILIIGVLLGGAYALMAMGLQLQYGVARIMNLANGEMLVAGSFAAFWIFTGATVSPILSIVVVAPLAFAINWLIYKIFMRPLVKRAKSEGQLEVDSILSTFGLSFIFVGLMLAVFGGEYFSYSYLEKPFEILSQVYALNRVIACWTEGVQKMKVGGKARLVCPSDIAYGERGSPPHIQPGATLVFEVELLGIE